MITMKRAFVLFFATGFGLGLSPFAPGTAGALVGIPLLLFLNPLAIGWQIVICLALVVAAIPLCGAAEDIYDKQDDHRIVADEYVTLPICMLGIPVALHPWFMIPAFIVNRLLDIVKPPPARQAQNLYGGYGIVMDDVISSLYALAVNHLLFRLLMHFHLL